MYGRVKMMTALCPAWAHTYQSMFLGGFSPDQQETLLKHPADRTDAAGCRIATVSLDIFVRILCGPFECDPRHPAFLGAPSCSTDTAHLNCFAEALRWTDLCLTLVVNRCVSSMIPSTLRELPWVSLMLGETLPGPTSVMSLFLRSNRRFHISVHHVFGHAGNAGNECCHLLGLEGSCF